MSVEQLLVRNFTRSAIRSDGEGGGRQGGSEVVEGEGGEGRRMRKWWTISSQAQNEYEHEAKEM